ncbi:MAG: hypothetical protein GY852_06115 [bacterium]|nr:hypothetical protein [bacterium]
MDDERTPPEENLPEDVDMSFEREEDLLSFVEERVKQINLRLDDLERMQNAESGEEFKTHANTIQKNIYKLQNIIKNNYAHFEKGKVVENWEEMPMYSLTVTLLERLTEIKDTNTVGV